ncbi:MAG: FecR domain-containing protein [Candidatus Brocadiae bacterium]|nr:FecR domain-containing protein [Candidatus Brocadiia bacterium]
MKTTQPRKAFTLAELAITVAIMAVLTGLVMQSARRTRAAYRASICQSNQRQIGLTLHLYYNKHGKLPPDTGTLEGMMCEFISDDKIFVCPNDDDPDAIDSYGPYYVRRRNPHDMDGHEHFLLGCPRHRSAVSSYTTTRSTLSTLATVLTDDGRVVDQAASVDERTITDGALRFADGSTVTVKSANDDYRVTVIQSFRLPDGSLYTVVRVAGDGEVDVSVTPGSRFEVVTPGALIGVRGTVFNVKTEEGGQTTTVVVTQGTVVLEPKLTKLVTVSSIGSAQMTHRNVLNAGDTGTVDASEAIAEEEEPVAPPPDGHEQDYSLCKRCNGHCWGGYHCKKCVLEPKYESIDKHLWKVIKKEAKAIGDRDGDGVTDPDLVKN